LDDFQRFICSIFPVGWRDVAGPRDQCFILDLNGELIELIFFMDESRAMQLGKKRLSEIWNNLGRWNDLAFEILRKKYEGNADEELSLRKIDVYHDGSFALGYNIHDDPDNLHLFVTFKKQGRQYLPETELEMETY
jgi:hypothetical protein